MDKRLLFTGAVLALAAGAALFRPARPAAPAASFAVEPRGGDRAEPARDPAGGSGAPAQAGDYRRPRSGFAARRAAGVVIYVAGEVRRPGVYSLRAGERADAAVRAAGGFSPGADPVAVNLAEPLSDGEEVAVPAIGAQPPYRTGSRTTGHHATGRRHRRSRRQPSEYASDDALGDDGRSAPTSENRRTVGSVDGAERAKSSGELVDLNAADAATLATLPGIGHAMAQRIVDFRELNGPFSSLDDLLDVAGTSQRTIDELEPYVFTGGLESRR